jgi:flagellar basal body L-ring protein FlgH
VRQLDITPANTVGSAQVADARISITGEGGNTRQVTRGPVGQLFDTLIWAAWPF